MLGDDRPRFEEAETFGCEIDEARLRNIPQTLPLAVVKLFHSSRSGTRAHAMAGAYAASLKQDTTELGDPTLGQMEELKMKITCNPQHVRPVLVYLEEATGAPFPCEVTEKLMADLSRDYIRFISHELAVISKIGLRQLYGGVIANIWDTVKAAHSAAKYMREWNEPEGDLDTAHLSLLDLTADGARSNDDVEYWRDRLIEAIGRRALYRKAVMPTLQGVNRRLQKEEEQLREDLAASLLGAAQLADGGGPMSGGIGDLLKRLGAVTVPIGAPFDDSERH